MKKLLFHIRSQIPTTPELAWDVAQDYTHFIYLHRKNFACFDVLYDDGSLQAFYYISKPFPFLPFGKRFISVRKLNHESMSLNQIYKPVDGRNRRQVWFHFQVNKLAEDRVEWDGTYLYPVTGLMAAFPRILAHLFERRIRRIWGEDEEMMLVRHALGTSSLPQCGPLVNPVLAGDLLANLETIENLISKAKDPDVRSFDFPPRP